ncbi:hypothetical protein H6771_01115 [Candidatus Peribacteria bacterium]|nr:hypothetical protein [Candidatus Peribacteria bacterium]
MHALQEDSSYSPHQARQVLRRRLVVARQIRWAQQGMSALLLTIVGLIGAGYILSLNAQNVAGYSVSQLMREQADLKAEIHSLQAKIARASAHDFVSQSPTSGTMVLQGTPSFLVLQPSSLVQATPSTP